MAPVKTAALQASFSLSGFKFAAGGTVIPPETALARHVIPNFIWL